MKPALASHRARRAATPYVRSRSASNHAPQEPASPRWHVPGHCPECETYEAAVLAMPPGGSIDAAIKPCAAYVMSDALRDHIVAQMRSEVTGQVSGAGLDRMGIVRSPGSGAAPGSRAAQTRAADGLAPPPRGFRLGPGGVPMRRRKA